MALRQNSAEGQASGTTLTAANSGGSSGDAFDTVSISGAACTFDNAQAMHGSQSYHINGASTQTAILIYSGANDTSGAVRAYIRFNTLPSSGQDLMVLRNGTGNAAKFGISGTNKFTISDSAGTILNTFTTAVSAGTWYRIELECVPGTTTTNGTISGRYCLGDSTTVQDTAYSSSAVNAGTTNITNGRAGKITSTAGPALDCWVDDFGFNNGSSSPIGPIGSVTAVVANDNVAAITPSISAEFAVTGAGPAQVSVSAPAPTLGLGYNVTAPTATVGVTALPPQTLTSNTAAVVGLGAHVAHALPFALPGGYAATSSSSAVSRADRDTGGYDFSVGGYGFRFATNKDFPYERITEPTTTHRYDSSLEPGEQSLSPLPWVKSQSSFHGGAGQQNLEQGYTAFQYQSEQIEHIRFDACLGVDVWTPGKVTRLPDCRFYSLNLTNASCMVSGTVSGVDYAIIGGNHLFYQVAWSSGPDADPTVTAIDMTGATYGGISNVNITSLTTDGAKYYAVAQLTTAGSTVNVLTLIITGSINSAAAPTVLYNGAADSTQHPAIVGWQKARLVGCVGRALYELDPSAAGGSALPTAKYTHPSTGWTWTATSESPSGVLAAGQTGNQAAVLEFTLDNSGAVPTLSGGATVASLPLGETIYSLEQIVGSFIAIGTNKGIRVGTFETYTGALKLGPISVDTTSPVYSLATRDRFVYLSYTDQQADLTTGLARVDLSMVVDAAGRNAWAPDLRPATTASSTVGKVACVTTLPQSVRMVYTTPAGLHVEGASPGADGDAWLRTSRIRWGTAELKLFKLGRIHGSLDVANIQITGIAPYGVTSNLGTFGFINNNDPGEFRLPAGLNEWIQLQFDLQGSACTLNSYQVKGLPAPKRQHIITVTALCFTKEVDRGGLEVTDPVAPRDRWQAVKDLEAAGNEVRFVEFTNNGPVAELVVIDQLGFQSFSPPNEEDDFGGYITLKLRTTES